MGVEDAPFLFQRRFATADALPNLVRVPTGLGKTATVVLGWIWRRFYAAKNISKAIMLCQVEPFTGAIA